MVCNRYNHGLDLLTSNPHSGPHTNRATLYPPLCHIGTRKSKPPAARNGSGVRNRRPPSSACRLSCLSGVRQSRGRPSLPSAEIRCGTISGPGVVIPTKAEGRAEESGHEWTTRQIRGQMSRLRSASLDMTNGAGFPPNRGRLNGDTSSTATILSCTLSLIRPLSCLPSGRSPAMMRLILQEKCHE